MENGSWQAEDLAARMLLPAGGWIGEILFLLLILSELRVVAFLWLDLSLFPEFLSSGLKLAVRR